MKALLKNNVVIDIADNPFPVHESLNWMDCEANVKNGWILKNGTLVASDVPKNDGAPMKSLTDKKIDALIKAVLTNDKTDLENLNGGQNAI